MNCSERGRGQTARFNADDIIVKLKGLMTIEDQHIDTWTFHLPERMMNDITSGPTM